MIAHTAYPSEDNQSVLIRTRSGTQMEIICTPEQYLAGLDAYKSGKAMQEAFAFISNDEREFLISGLTPDEWNRIFPQGDSDGE